MNLKNGISCHVITVVTAVKDLLDQQPLKYLSIAELTSYAAINRNLLQGSFKKLVGFTISEYQLQKRMERAAQLLSEGRYSIKEIAVKCKYQPNSFSKAFRKVYGMSPTDWQKEHMECSFNHTTPVVPMVADEHQHPADRIHYVADRTQL